MSYIIAGLGNPGEEYKNTRHNTGRIILECLKSSAQADFLDWKSDSKNKTLISSGEISGKKVTLLLPNNFMNSSGASFRTLIKSKKTAEGLVVIHDDLDLPLGKFRISFNRG